VGHNSFGHPEYDTTRSAIGELLHRLKYRGDATAIGPLAEAAATFLLPRRDKVDGLVPVPPSDPARRPQPVMEIAAEICRRTGITLCTGCISKVKATPQLKDVSDPAQRAQILADAFVVDRSQTEGKALLVFDDLYRSGVTAGAITRLLQDEDKGAASRVYLLTLTQTRRNA